MEECWQKLRVQMVWTHHTEPSKKMFIMHHDERDTSDITERRILGNSECSFLRDKSQGAAEVVPQPALQAKEADVEISRFMTLRRRFSYCVFCPVIFPLLFAWIVRTPTDHTHLQGEATERVQELQSTVWGHRICVKWKNEINCATEVVWTIVTILARPLLAFHWHKLKFYATEFPVLFFTLLKP